MKNGLKTLFNAACLIGGSLGLVGGGMWAWESFITQPECLGACLDGRIPSLAILAVGTLMFTAGWRGISASNKATKTDNIPAVKPSSP